MKLGFIGAGNMGGAILRGIIKRGFADPADLWVSDVNEAACRRLQEETGVHGIGDNKALVQQCDMILLAVKPVYLGGVLEELRPCLAGKRVISIAAGWTFAMLKEAAGTQVQILRAMPNTPAMVGEGMTALCQENTFDEASLAYAKGLFGAVGKVVLLPERLFDGVIAVSGSSPAYVFMLIEAMGDAAVREGLPRKNAYEMAAQAVLGSAKMALESGKHPGELKDMVCSPAGTTIDGVIALEKNGFRFAVMEAMSACAAKSKEMSK